MSKFKVVAQLAGGTYEKTFLNLTEAYIHMEWVVYNLDPISCNMFYYKRHMTGE